MYAEKGWGKKETETNRKVHPALPPALADSFPSPSLKSFIHENGNSLGTCICMAESLCCALETITTLLIGYTPI